METFAKDPDAVLDYSWDWSGWLAAGETISTSSVTVPAGITKDSEVGDGDSVTVWLSGGTGGTIYSVTCRITTTDSRTEDRTILISVGER